MSSQSEFATPLSLLAVTSGAEAAPAARAGAVAWTLWGRGTASGFDGQPKADFLMAGTVLTGYLGVEYRLQPNVLLGLAVAHSQGDVDVRLTSVMPYALWSPRPGLGVCGLVGAGCGCTRGQAC